LLVIVQNNKRCTAQIIK